MTNSSTHCTKACVFTGIGAGCGAGLAANVGLGLGVLGSAGRVAEGEGLDMGGRAGVGAAAVAVGANGCFMAWGVGAGRGFSPSAPGETGGVSAGVGETAASGVSFHEPAGPVGCTPPVAWGAAGDGEHAIVSGCPHVAVGAPVPF
nr:hypothetical protein [bacterium]